MSLPGGSPHDARRDDAGAAVEALRGAGLPDWPQVGDVLAGKYAIEGLIGTGGMGYVLAARHVQLGERVAIKLLLPEEAARADAVSRFLQEARATVRMRSEHVIRVLDLGEERRTPYIVMEYLEGSDLSDLVRSHRRLPPALAVDYVLQACEAIAEAHALGIVHRDLKPANLFLVRRPDGTDAIKVLDFGISKMTARGSEAMTMTATKATLGTPLYMSPEQLKSSKNVDERTDLWALGVILFELIAGRPPFVADNLAELGALVLREDAPDVRGFAAAVAPGLAQAIANCLERDLPLRTASVAELAAALAPFSSGAARASAEAIVRALTGEEAPRIALARAARPPPAQTGPHDTLLTEGMAIGHARTERSERDVRTGTGEASGSAVKTALGRRLFVAAACAGALAVAGAGVRLARARGPREVAAEVTPPPPTATSGSPARDGLGEGTSPPATTSSVAAPLPPPSASAAARTPSTPTALSAPHPASAPPPVAHTPPPRRPPPEREAQASALASATSAPHTAPIPTTPPGFSPSRHE